MISLALNKTFSYGKVTQTADTVITRTIPPSYNAFTHITNLKYTAAGTAHTVTVMRPLAAPTTLTSAAAASQAVINVAALAGSLAANDYLVIEKPDGTYHTGIVSSVSTLAVTLTANVPSGGFASGAKVWNLGVAADHTNLVFNGIASATTTYNDYVSSVAATVFKEQPMIVYSNNATAAGTLENVSGGYSPSVSAVV